jgi:hypothetical protein
MTLYAINEQIQNILESCYDPDPGEIYDEELMVQYDSLRLQKEEKAENVACFIKNLEAEATAIKEEAKKLASRAKVAENKAAHLKGYLQFCLQGEKLSTPRAAVSYRKSKMVDVEEDAWQFLPEQYLRIKQPEPDKKAIGEALKAGQTLPGCKLVENVSMIIK